MEPVTDGFDYDAGWGEWVDMKRYGPTSRHTRRLIWKLVRGLEFASVLDVGCGEGSPLEDIAARRPGVELAGVDVSARAVAAAARRLPAARFSVLDVARERLPRQFDLVVCSDVVEHIEDDGAALASLRAMARRWCLVSTLQGRMRSFEATVGHVRNYRRGELQERMEQAGFAVRRVVEWGFPFFSPLYRDLLERMPPGATTGRFGLARKLTSHALYGLFLANSERRGDYVLVLGEAR